MKLYFSYLLVFFCLWGNDTTAQNLNPPIHNYSTVDYAAGSQNWDIAVDKKGIIYSANNQGLLSFDGQRWEMFPLDKGTALRSVFPHEGRIYTGSYKEFGYWSRDDKGQMSYTSLIPKLGDYELQSEEFWEILSYRDAIYFRSFGAIYKYEKDSIRPLKNVVVNKMGIYRDKLLLAVRQDGLFFLDENGELNPLGSQEILKGKIVIDFLVKGDSIFVGTREGVYKFDGASFSQFADGDFNERMRDSEFNRIISASEDDIIIGTVKNGLIDYNLRTGKYKVYNRNSGLQNNTVLGMAKRRGKIWLALDHGIDEIHLDSPIKFYKDETGELGAVYDLAFKGDDLYLASNTGVFSFKDNKPKLIEGSQDHTWNLELIDNSLYANHNTGTYRIQDNRFLPIEKRTGSFQIREMPGREKIFLLGTYTGLSKFDAKEERITQIKGVEFPVKKIILEDENTLWLKHPYDGVYRVGLEENLEKSRFVKKIKSANGQKSYGADIFKIHDRIAVLNDGNWYEYNVFRDTLEVFSELGPFTHHRLIWNGKENYWFTDTRNNSLVYTDLKEKKVVLGFRELDQRLVKENENIIKVNDSIFYVTLIDGFATINLNKLLLSREMEEVAAPILMGIADMETEYSLQGEPEIPYKNARELRVKAALPDSEAAVLKYRLEGSSQMEGEVKDGTIEFQNLNHGDYDLKLFAMTPQGEVSEDVSYNFSVAPPWYLSNLMKVVYLLIMFSIVGFFYWFNRLKLNKHQWLLEQKFEKEHRERVNKMEKERLMNEIDLKRKELANSTMMAVKKNEVLMEIQSELNKDKDKFSNQYRLKHIMNKINTAIKNKDEWKVFETNFNELHEDFFRDLLDKYPKLSNKDLKLCSYLKMNLTSKEIAPLMGISVRGVEVHRYRLRKKMDLDKQENLNNFLIKNF